VQNSALIFGAGLVGREHALNQLSRACDDVLLGQGRLVIIEGESGIGKSCLMSALCDYYAPRQGWLVLSGRGVFQMESQPYLLFKDLVRDWVHATNTGESPPHEPAIRGLSFEQFLTFAEERLDPHISMDLQTSGQARMYDVVSHLIFEVAKDRPLLLVLEDVHWADLSSLDLLSYLVQRIATSKIMLCLTYRPASSPESAASRVLGDIIRRSSVETLGQRIVLTRFDEPTTGQLIAATLTPCDFPEEFVRMIYQETEGVPLYVLELLKALRAQGTIVSREGILRLDHQVERIKLPESLMDLVSVRFNDLSEGDRELLEYASVVGRRFSSQVLAQATHRTRLSVLKRLQALERRHHLIHAREDGFAFDHNLIHEVIYQDIPDELRREYHVIIGNCLERDPLTEVFELALHYACGHCYDKAIRYSTQAGERAEVVYAYLEAIHYYEQALNYIELISPSAIEKSFALLNKLGDLYSTTTRLERSLHYYQIALTHQGHVPDRVDDVRLYRNIGLVHILRGDYQRALDVYQEGLSHVPRDEHDLQAAQLCYDVACAYLKIGQEAEALQWCRRAVPAARSLTLDVDFDQFRSVYELLPALSELAGYAAQSGPADVVGITGLPNTQAVVYRAIPQVTRPLAYNRSHASMPSVGHLTQRELDVVRLVVCGDSNKEIAVALGISSKTVDRHLANTFAKAEVRSRSQLVTYAFLHGLVAMDGRESPLVPAL